MKLESITIAIPAYNAEKYIYECLSTIVHARAVASALIDVQIVVVNDASTDSTIDVLHSFESYDFIRIINNKENLGQAISTNRAVNASKTKWVQIFHADDYVSHDHFLHIASILQTPIDDKPALIVVERSEVDCDGKTKGNLAPLFSHSCSIPSDVISDIFLRTGFLPCQVVFGLEQFQKVGGIDEAHEINLDGLLWFKISHYGDTRYSTKATTFYRRHETSITSQANNSCLQIFEYYSTLKQMIAFAKAEHNYNIDSSRYMPSLVRYSIRIAKSLAQTKPEVSKDYLLVAELLLKTLNPVSCSDEINSIFELLEGAKKDCTKYKKEYLDYVRDFSYDVPEKAMKVFWNHNFQKI